MSGITSFGVYIPMYRLDRDEIASMWGGAISRWKKGGSRL